MILCTKACDALVKNALSRDQRGSLSIKRFTEIINLFSVDPAVSESPIEAFIISSADIKAPKMSQMFEAQLQRKHPGVRVILIVKEKKPSKYSSGVNGIDKVLVMPKPQDVGEAIYEVASKLSEKPKVESAAEKAAQLQPKDYGMSVDDVLSASMSDDVRDAVMQSGEETAATEETSSVPSDLFDNFTSLEEDPDAIAEEAPPENISELAKRMQEANNFYNIASFMRENNAQTVLRDLAKTNAEYGVIEDKIRALKEEIFSIWTDTNLSTNQKTEKIRTLQNEKRYYTGKSSTAIEEYLYEIIQTLTSVSDKILTKKLDELNRMVLSAAKHGEGYINNGRLSGITEERANLLIELNTLEAEIDEVAAKAVDIVTEISNKVAKEATDDTGSDNLNRLISQFNTQIANGETIKALMGLNQIAVDSTEFYDRIKNIVSTIQTTQARIIQLDKEEIATMNDLVRFFKSQKIEDNVIANTLLKKALRVFIADEGVGRSIVPYLIAQYHSRQSANVLLLDLTGTCKWDMYDIDAITMDKYIADRPEEQFCKVYGTCTTPESAQSLVAMLTMAADYYRCIYVVLPKNIDNNVYSIIASDTLVINYLTDAKIGNVTAMKEFFTNNIVENTARRILVNNSCIPESQFVEMFDLFNDIQTQLVTIPHIPQIELAAYRKFNPKDVDVVITEFEEVLKYA